MTSGVILEFESGCFVFQTGLNRAGDALGVVRLGGHVEPGETAVDCARREVREEGNVDPLVVAADLTWSYGAASDGFELTPFEGSTSDPRPLLVASTATNPLASVTYLAVAKSRPSPGAETQALVFLTAEDVERLTAEEMSLAAFLASGGELVEATPLPRELTLRPHAQLKALAELMRRGSFRAGAAEALGGSP